MIPGPPPPDSDGPAFGPVERRDEILELEAAYDEYVDTMMEQYKHPPILSFQQWREQS